MRSLTRAAFASGFLILLAGLLLSGCARRAVPLVQDESVAAEAGAKLDRLALPLPENLMQRQVGPVAVAADPALPAATARRKWNEDRARLRACVATHQALVKEIRLRDISGQVKGANDGI